MIKRLITLCLLIILCTSTNAENVNDIIEREAKAHYEKYSYIN